MFRKKKNDSFLLTHFLNNANFKVAFLSQACSAMKSIIFDLSVSRQHGELLRGLHSADMFSSAKNFHIVFESIEICRCSITGFLFSLHQAVEGHKPSVYRHRHVYCFLYIKNRESYWILNKNYVKGVACVIIIPSCRVHGSHLEKFRRGQLLKNIPAVQSERHEQTKDRIHLCLYFANNEKPTLCMPFSPTLLFHENCSVSPPPPQHSPPQLCSTPSLSGSSLSFFSRSQILHAPSLCGVMLC